MTITLDIVWVSADKLLLKCGQMEFEGASTQ